MGSSTPRARATPAARLPSGVLPASRSWRPRTPAVGVMGWSSVVGEGGDVGMCTAGVAGSGVAGGMAATWARRRSSFSRRRARNSIRRSLMRARSSSISVSRAGAGGLTRAAESCGSPGGLLPPLWRAAAALGVVLGPTGTAEPGRGAVEEAIVPIAACWWVPAHVEVAGSPPPPPESLLRGIATTDRAVCRGGGPTSVR